MIGANQNLDSYQTPGLYAQDANANTSAALNYPENNAGSLMVLKGAGITQVYRVYNSSRIWSRSKYSTGPWTTWAREYNTLNKPTFDELGLNEWRYPVGSYYENEFDSRNPSVILGFGVWESRPGLLYGAGTITDKDGLSLTIPVGPVKGRLFIGPANIKTFSGDVTLNMDHVPDHAHGVAKGTTGGGSGAQNGPPNGGSFASGYAGGHTPTGRGRLVNGDIGTQKEPFLIPGYATYRWVRTA